MTEAIYRQALLEIAMLSSSSEPVKQDGDTSEEAEAHGLRLGLLRASEIARRALVNADDRCELINNRPYSALTNAERAKLHLINHVLSDIERRYHQIALDMIRQMKARYRGVVGGFDDYELELSIAFYPDADDPACYDDDGLIGKLCENLKDIEEKPRFAFGALDHNHALSEIFPSEHHCWLYHCAYDHTRMSWNDLLRVKRIWVDIAATLQEMVPID